MKAKELRELDNAALNEKLAEARQELFNLRFSMLLHSWKTPRDCPMSKETSQRSSPCSVKRNWEHKPWQSLI